MNVELASPSTQTDIAIIGAGSQALTLVAHLLQKRSSLNNKFVTIDPSGKWMSRWQQQFAALKIPHLRSPAVHHPDPNPYALRRFAEGRSDELFPPYDLPGTQLFDDFCRDVVHRWQLEDRVLKAAVTRIQPITDWGRCRFQLELETGQLLKARRVVLATGSGKLQLPDWAHQISSAYPQERLRHSQQVDLRELHLQGERILIVGGGLTSGHLAVGAIALGAKVQIMVRRQLQERLFDADPGWLGPKYLKAFRAEADWEQRSSLIQQARNGGSMTPAIMTQLRRYSRSGQLRFDEQCEIVKAEWQDSCWRVSCTDGSEHECDRIWLATGTRFDATTEPLLKEVQEAFPTEMINGLPVLDEHLRWSGCELFVMGGLAALQLGPVARNLSGARMAGDRIVPALTKSSLALLPVRNVS
ncbi:MAG: lysine N(6)-hydroxylase/L-ornithine N(5)-oxygenase family protein [Kastovskya adunca ATA6-11-RM4]|jgi:cation diffusion facilitator CzcD-associated flavoprotein CzcO|nr:lysine N(6)-hydroxylase/L-ornithine N(5)-oxygenase family protein [Kastovskya adunca ATA6-11-RM4]